MTTKVPALSVVGSVYQGAETIERFYKEATEAAAEAGLTYEIVLVDDGSRDASFECMRRLQRSDPTHARVFQLSRNFGHHAAVGAALEFSRGELVFLLDTDLQDRPGLLRTFLDELRAHSVDVVYGYQERRHGKTFERVSGTVFWWLFNRLTGLRMTPSPVTTRLMSRRYVDALLGLREYHRFTAGLMEWIGFPQRAIPVVRAPRPVGKSHYVLTRKLQLFLTALTSFSAYPLQFATRLGFGITFVGITLALYILVRKLFQPEHYAAGWVSLSSLIVILGGLNLTLIGMVGAWLARTYEQVKGRPRFIVMESVDQTDHRPIAGLLKDRPVTRDKKFPLAG